MGYAAMFLGLALAIVAVFEFRKAYGYTHVLNTNTGETTTSGTAAVCGYACAAVMLVSGLAVMAIELMGNL